MAALELFYPANQLPMRHLAVVSEEVASEILAETGNESSLPSSASKKGSKSFLTQHSPKLNSTPPKKEVTAPRAVDPNDPFAGLDLQDGKNAEAFMALILLASILTAQNQGKVSKSNTDLSSTFIQLSQNLLNKAQDDLKKYLDAVEAAKHSSWLSDFFSYFVAAITIVIGVIFEQPELAVAGALMIMMKASGGQDALDTELAKLPLGLKIFCEVLIAAAQAAACFGAGAGIESMAAKFATKGTEAGAADAAASGGAAGSAAGADAAADVADVSSSTINQATRTSSQLIKKGLQMLSQQLMNGQFWSDLMRVFMRVGDVLGAKTGSDKEDEAASIGGAVLGAVTTFGTGFLNTGKSVALGLSERLSQTMGDFQFAVLKGVVQMARSAMAITTAAYTIVTGMTELKKADIIEDQANNNAMLVIFDFMEDLIGNMMNSNMQSDKNTNQADNDIAGRMEDIFVTSWQVN
jgi:hypothetical protein